MSLKKLALNTSPLALAVALAACGSASVDEVSDAGDEPQASAAIGTGSSSEVTASRTVNGRVADGYIQGANVCVDLNENDACDEGEPVAVTGPGGTYELDIPTDAQDKPIVADIPAEAIDEDTGEAIGKPLVFVAPADKPEFVSPITTLIHQELQSNPALTVDDAEVVVKRVLGVDESDISLFADYVAGGESDEADMERKNDFTFLHNTARVVASMMKDIETQVESAAQSEGVDVVGSTQTRQAIRDIVRREVRELLPQIAQQVSVIVGSDQTDSADQQPGVPSVPGVPDVNRTDFDPEQLAISLRPEGVADRVQEKIDAVVERAEPLEADIRQALADGVYWLEYDCEYAMPYGEVDVYSGIDQDTASDTNLPVHDCEGKYGIAQLNDSGDQIMSHNFYFDAEFGVWMEEEEDYDSGYSDFSLVNGEWVAIDVEGPNGDVTFNDDGTAVITNAEGEMRLKAVTRPLDSIGILKHFWANDVDESWYSLAEPSDLFSAGSQNHMISVKQEMNPYTMFNMPTYDDGECAEYYDNCNVVGKGTDVDFQAYNSLMQLQEGAIQGAELYEYHSRMGQGGTMKLLMDGDYDGSLPTSGIVEWTFNPAYTQDGYTDDNSPYDVDDRDYQELDDDVQLTMERDVCYKAPVTTDSPVPTNNPVPTDLHFPTDESLEQQYKPSDQLESDEDLRVMEDDLSLPLFDPINHVYELPSDEYCLNQVKQPGVPAPDASYPVYPVEATDFLQTSSWKIVTVDDVQMIEITMPDGPWNMDINVHGDSPQALLLIEHEGVIRMGARLSHSFIDRVLTYNEAAFSSLRALVERGVTASQSSDR